MEFTYRAYKKLLTAIDQSGYVFTDYSQCDRVANPCIMRHDVDLNPKKALEMAMIEANLTSIEGGVKATYFFMLNTDFYNLCSSENRKIMERIQMMNHTIGLHFDETSYDIHGDWSILLEKCEEELSVLSKLAGKTIDLVSMHRPSKNLLSANIKFPHAINTYSEKFFKAFKYFSDSRMNWREDVKTAVACRQYKQLHILTHPFWYHSEVLSTREILLDFFHDASVERYDLLSGNFRDLNEFVRREEAIV